MWRIVVAGGRNFEDYTLMASTLDKLLSVKVLTQDIVVISGAAKGADSLGERYAKQKGYLLKQYPAKWDVYGKAAGSIRNLEMARNSDCTLVFWDGKSRGTANMIEMTKQEGNPCRVIKY